MEITSKLLKMWAVTDPATMLFKEEGSMKN